MIIMRSFTVFLVLSLTALSLAKKGNGGKASKAMCLSEEDARNMMKICHAGSTLGERLRLPWRLVLSKLNPELRKEKEKSQTKEREKERSQQSALNSMRLCNGLKRNMQEKSACSLKWDGWTMI